VSSLFSYFWSSSAGLIALGFADLFFANLHQGNQIDATIQHSSVRREHLGHSRLG